MGCASVPLPWSNKSIRIQQDRRGKLASVSYPSNTPSHPHIFTLTPTLTHILLSIPPTHFTHHTLTPSSSLTHSHFHISIPPPSLITPSHSHFLTPSLSHRCQLPIAHRHPGGHPLSSYPTKCLCQHLSPATYWPTVQRQCCRI